MHLSLLLVAVSLGTASAALQRHPSKSWDTQASANVTWAACIGACGLLRRSTKHLACSESAGHQRGVEECPCVCSVAVGSGRQSAAQV